MYTSYTYGKFRHEFGKQCRFSKCGPTVMVSLLPDISQEEQWIPKNPVNKYTNYSIEWSEHEANTTRVEYAERGILHTEGGWPKDINLEDAEHMVRYRKKAEKDDMYLAAVPQMASLAEHFVNQNNSIDIYQSYFVDPNCQKMQTMTPSYRTVAVMSDPCEPIRPVKHISWSPDQGTMVAVSYANMGFQMADSFSSPDSFIFDMADFTVPYFTIESPYPIITLEFNHRESNFLAGGLMSGQVAFWDMRKNNSNVAISDIRNSHRDPVKSLHWIHSKTSTEFYTGSSDGQVMWWDTRKLAAPIEAIILDFSKNENNEEPEWTKWARSHGVSCMDYDLSIPVRFMIGTETGFVFNGNRKGRTVLEKISATYNCHYGPIYSVQRNPAYLKNFLTIGDWQVRIWSDDVKESPIMWTKHYDVRLTDGVWSESKPSVLYTTRADGCMDCWDILQKQKDPILTIKIADQELNCIRCHESGVLVAVGDNIGKTHVIKMNDWFVNPGKNDKGLLMAMFDRETKREKIIESKQREIKLKSKSTVKVDAIAEKNKLDRLAEDEILLVESVSKEFDELIAKINENAMNDNDIMEESENQEEEENNIE